MHRPIPEQIAALGIDEIYIIDAEFRPSDPSGYEKYGLSADIVPDTLEPVCLSAKMWTTGEIVSAWSRPGESCPVPVGDDVLFVAYQAPAEWSYFLAKGWELPTNIIDLYAEYRRAINGRFDQSGDRVGHGQHKESDGRTKYGLLSACIRYGLQARAGIEKQSIVKRILQGAPFSEEERGAILRYNAEDVEDAELIFTAMLDSGDISNVGQALMRGDATRGFAVRDLNGLPIDVAIASRLRTHWDSIRSGLAHAVEDSRHYDVFRFDADGSAHFDRTRMIALVERLGMQDIWPRTEERRYSFAGPERGDDDDKPFKRMAMLNPYLEDLRQTRKLLETFKNFDLPIQQDGRCRGKYAPWVQVTGRSSPGKGSIFGMPAWVRWLIKPGEGRGVAYVDLKSAEFGIAAGLSRDPNMMQDYRDMIEGRIECVYFELAKSSGQVPMDAKVADHKPVRRLWKTASLAIMYGQSPEGLSQDAGISISSARVIQDAFKRRYSTFWHWTRQEIVHAHCRGKIETVCGWRMDVNARTKEGTLQNFHPQATCADIMRRAVALMADRGIAICEIVHDAVMVEAPMDMLEDTVRIAHDCWRQASREVLGFELEADTKRCVYPLRYEDEDGKSMWHTLMGLLAKAGRDSGTPATDHLQEGLSQRNAAVDGQLNITPADGPKISEIFSKSTPLFPFPAVLPSDDTFLAEQEPAGKIAAGISAT